MGRTRNWVIRACVEDGDHYNNQDDNHDHQNDYCKSVRRAVCTKKSQVIKECVVDDHDHQDNPDPRDVAR